MSRLVDAKQKAQTDRQTQDQKLGKKKNVCFRLHGLKIRVGRLGFFYFFLKPTNKYAPSSKITHTCLLLSYYSLLII